MLSLVGAISLPVLLLASLLLLVAGHEVAARLLRLRGLGAFGLHPTDDYFCAPLWKRLLVRAAGPAAVWLLASTLAFAGLMLTGTLRLSMQVDVTPASPASRAGILDGDVVTAVAGVPVQDWDRLREAIAAHRGERIQVDVQREGAAIPMFPVVDASGKVGLRARTIREPMPPTRCAGTSIAWPARIMAGVVAGVAHSVTGGEKVELAGPVGVAKETSRALGSSSGNYLVLVATLASYFWPMMLIIDAVMAFAIWNGHRLKVARAKQAS